MEKNKSYYDQRNIDTLQKIRSLLLELPDWFGGFMRACETTHSALTRLNYCFDTRVFLTYLVQEHPDFYGYSMKNITTDMIGRLSLTDLEIYVEYLGYYVDSEENEHENAERGKARKIASLRSLFKYLYKKERISSNPAELLDMPKIHEKAIVHLSPEEVAAMIDVIESGEGLSKKQLQYHKQTMRRDAAICVLFLTTGIRISELVGLDIADVDFENLSFKVTRKGGNQSILYFDAETKEALQKYIDERKAQGSYSLRSPLFLSMQNKRMSVRSVENMVEKYARIAAPLKKITPHKLRSTYGTMLYQETRDIYLVADVLGHKDVNTTRRHYASMSDENRKRAAKAIRLRKKSDE